MQTHINQKTAIITGASRGIGKAIALTLAEAGYALLLNCSTSKEELLALQTWIHTNYSVPCLTYVGDVGDAGQAAAMFQTFHHSYNKLDILINNAGVSYHGLLTDMTPADWQDVLRTNLSSVFYCSRLAIPPMLSAKSGKIINISSVWGSVGASCEVAYSASKGGLNAFTRALAKELAPSNIQVNAIACGCIDTAMNQFLSDEERQVLTDEIPSGRMGEPKEVALLVRQLCESPAYLTGQVITLDGGWL